MVPASCAVRNAAGWTWVKGSPHGRRNGLKDHRMEDVMG